MGLDLDHLAEATRVLRHQLGNDTLLDGILKYQRELEAQLDPPLTAQQIIESLVNPHGIESGNDYIYDSNAASRRQAGPTTDEVVQALKAFNRSTEVRY